MLILSRRELVPVRNLSRETTFDGKQSAGHHDTDINAFQIPGIGVVERGESQFANGNFQDEQTQKRINPPPATPQAWCSGAAQGSWSREGCRGLGVHSKELEGFVVALPVCREICEY